MPIQYQKNILFIVISFMLVLGVNQSNVFKHTDLTVEPPVKLESLIAENPLLFFQTINVNTATAQELEAIPRIGPVLAARIINSRRTNGLYEKLEDLERVQGIGSKTVKRLRAYCHVK